MADSKFDRKVNANDAAETPDSIDEQTVDPRDLVNKGGYQKSPREIVEHPAVTPQMLDERRQTEAGLGAPDEATPDDENS